MSTLSVDDVCAMWLKAAHQGGCGVVALFDVLPTLSSWAPALLGAHTHLPNVHLDYLCMSMCSALMSGVTIRV